jgi:hypothetical protein
MQLSHSLDKKRRTSNIIGFLILVGLIGKFFWTLLNGIAEDVLVVSKLKRRPPSGRAVWRWRKLP